MKDPVSVLGCWRGFRFWLDGPTQGDSTANGSNDYSIFSRAQAAQSSIEMPDLDITAVHKLASGLQGLRVYFGVDRFVRSYAIISINQVSPIRRHGVLLPSSRQRAGAWNWRKGAMQEPNGTSAPAAGDSFAQKSCSILLRIRGPNSKLEPEPSAASRILRTGQQ